MVTVYKWQKILKVKVKHDYNAIEKLGYCFDIRQLKIITKMTDSHLLGPIRILGIPYDF